MFVWLHSSSPPQHIANITSDARYWNPIKETLANDYREARRLFDTVYLPARVAGERGGRPYADNLAYLSTHRHQIDYAGPWAGQGA